MNTVVTLTTDEVLEVSLLIKVQLLPWSRKSADFINGAHNILLLRKTFMCHCRIIIIIITVVVVIIITTTTTII
jgi:hypothetical protein